MYGKSHADEARDKMREAKLGRTLSEELKAKLSKAATGRKFTEEHKASLSAAKQNSQKVSVLDLQTGIETIYASINVANRELDFPKDAIRLNLKSKGQKPYRGRYVFKKLCE